jgi:hypothetical protein
MGEARLHVVFGEGPEVLLPRSWPGWVSRSGRCPGTGRSRWGTGWRAADAAGPEVATDVAKGA